MADLRPVKGPVVFDSSFAAPALEVGSWVLVSTALLL